MILDIALLRFLIFLQRFRKALAPRIDAWIQDGTFQLQRRAYEAYGEGQWSGLDEEIPVHKPGEELAPLPVDSQPLDFPFRYPCCSCKCQNIDEKTPASLKSASAWQDLDEKPPLTSASTLNTDQITLAPSPSSSTEEFPPELKRPPTYNTSNAQWADKKSSPHSLYKNWKR